VKPPLISGGSSLASGRLSPETGNGGPEAPEALLSWLATDVALLITQFDSEAEVELTVDGQAAEVEARSFALPAEADGAAVAQAITIWVPVAVQGRGVEVVVRGGDAEIHLGPAPPAAIGVDLRTAIREGLADREAAIREGVLDFLAETPAAHERTLDATGLAKSLFVLREALRDPYPRAELRPEDSQALHVGAVAMIDERTFFVRGWARDDQAPITRLDAVSPEGARTPILEQLFRVPRPDLEELLRGATRPTPKPGFVSFFELPHPSRLAEGWIFELENSAGVGVESSGPAVTLDPLAVRDTILAELVRERRVETPLMDQLMPAVVRLQEELAARAEVDEVEELGAVPAEPEVSVVIPLYRRVDLIEHQLAQFANDPSLREQELIFVLDSPELAAELLPRVALLHDLYRVPFRLVTLTRNGGFAVATNLGAGLARGQRLLALNSDVLPDRPGWLGQLVAAHEALPQAGAVAPKLLYDDGSIQHAGLGFKRNPASGGWELAHSFKGLHRDFAGAAEQRSVPALSAACLLIERELFEQLGGLSVDYVKGGYEDAELCMRIQEQGLETWYVPEVELFHLEGRSYVPAATDMSNRFNAWLFHRRWGERVEQLEAAGGEA